MFAPALALLMLAISSGPSDESTPIEPPRQKHADLLQAMPPDTGVAVFVNLRGDSMIEQLIEAAADAWANDDEKADRLTKLIQSIPGPIVVGHVPNPRRDKDDGIVVAMDISKPGFDFRDWVVKKLLPVMRTMGTRDRFNALRLDGDGGAMRIINPRKENETIAYIAVRGRVAYLADRPDLARAAATSTDSDKSFADTPGVRKVLRELPKDAIVRVLFNPKPLFKELESPKPRSTGELVRQILAPDDLIAIGGFIRLKGNNIEAGATALLAEECKGIAKWFNRGNTESALVKPLAGEFPVLLRIGLSSLTSLPDAIYEITDNFDETISTEYREDLAAFNAKAGIDFNAQILGQIHDEIIIALRPDLSQQPPIAWSLVAPVKNPATLESACVKLTEHFELEFESRTTEGVTIHSAPQPTSVAWCVADNRLIFGDAFATVRNVVRRFKTGASQSSRHVVERGTRELGASNQWMLLTDVGLLCRQAPMLPVLAGPRFAPLLQDGYVGASISNHDRFVKLKFQWELGGKRDADDKSSAEMSDQLMVGVSRTLLEFVAEARFQAQTTIAMSHQRGIAMALHAYASAHDGNFPDSLEQLVKEQPDSMSLGMLENPFTSECPESIDEIAEYSHVVYRTGLSSKSGPQEIILAEKNIQNGPTSAGASFAFVDGHCEFHNEPLASRILEMIRDGEPTITIAAALASLEDGDAP